MAEMAVMGSLGLLQKALAKVPTGLLPDGIKGGDTKLIWDRNNRDEVDSARRTFDELKKKGFAAFAVRANGDKGEQIYIFDDHAEKMHLFARIENVLSGLKNLEARTSD